MYSLKFTRCQNDWFFKNLNVNLTLGLFLFIENVHTKVQEWYLNLTFKKERNNMNILRNKELLRGLLIQSDVLNTINGGTSQTSVNLVTTKESFIVKVKAPSVPVEAFNIVLNYNKITVFTEVMSQIEEESFSDDAEDLVKIPMFLKTFDIPYLVDSDKIEAVYEDNEVKIIMPFKEDSENLLRKINIKYL